MSGDHRLFGAERIDDADHVADQVKQCVLVDRLRPVGLAVAAHVGRDHAISGGRERGELMAPRVPGLGKSVAENDERSLPLFGKVQMNAVRLDRAMGDTARRHFGLRHIARLFAPRVGAVERHAFLAAGRRGL